VLAVSDELLDGSAPADGEWCDGLLAQALGARRSGWMGAAVATLQAEQDAVVRCADRGVTVVQGGPGTGKTVVSLHRAAFVLYAFPRAAERGVLVLGPSARFLDYISRVLPSLGEDGGVLARAVGRVAGAWPRAVGGGAAEGRVAMADALAGPVRSRQAPAGGFAVRVGGEWVRLPHVDVVRARDAAVAGGVPHNRARPVFGQCLADAVVAALGRGGRGAGAPRR
jgi:hypothetical protein